MRFVTANTFAMGMAFAMQRMAAAVHALMTGNLTIVLVMMKSHVVEMEIVIPIQMVIDVYVIMIISVMIAVPSFVKMDQHAMDMALVSQMIQIMDVIVLTAGMVIIVIHVIWIFSVTGMLSGVHHYLVLASVNLVGLWMIARNATLKYYVITMVHAVTTMAVVHVNLGSLAKIAVLVMQIFFAVAMVDV